ncbi:guanine nucleotide exchange factor [Thelonectria olida]|uniref:Guanine nucleotide exchange factor n=1 Tax=Thelonectria olida TaxID=1576542 RepID=A0A9P8W245_9HYPO|nr:guanine nucleotide exchange factor [Thelonectria olida]
MAARGLATGGKKSAAELVTLLSSDVATVTLSSEERIAYLDELKVYSRTPAAARPIYSSKAIATLCRLALYHPCLKTNLGAFRVLANATLMKAETRQMIVDQGSAHRLCKALEFKSWEQEFLVCRILLILTYNTTLDFRVLIDEHHLAQRMIENVARHAKALSGKNKANVDPMQGMALAETMKLLFNVCHFNNGPAHIEAFAPTVPHIVTLLVEQDTITSKPLDPPLGTMINALLNLDLATDPSKRALYPENDPNSVASKLIDLLDLCLSGKYSSHDLDVVVAPVTHLVRLVYTNAPDDTKEFLRGRLLPNDEDRKEVLGHGQGKTLSAKLLKQAANADTAMSKGVCHLLFEASDKDAQKFIDNVGFGLASGFLFQENIPVPESFAKGESTGNATGQRPINPITGQFIDAEKHVEIPEMSQEEKEREAERLFVLFERLKKTGIVDIQNPVEAAMREGRYRELKDDEVEEVDDDE